MLLMSCIILLIFLSFFGCCLSFCRPAFLAFECRFFFFYFPIFSNRFLIFPLFYLFLKIAISWFNFSSIFLRYTHYSSLFFCNYIFLQFSIKFLFEINLCFIFFFFYDMSRPFLNFFYRSLLLAVWWSKLDFFYSKSFTQCSLGLLRWVFANSFLYFFLSRFFALSTIWSFLH